LSPLKDHYNTIWLLLSPVPAEVQTGRRLIWLEWIELKMKW